MSRDAYSLCPCGSGKKFKFCCAALGNEIDRIERLIEGNQSRQALQVLSTLKRKHPDNPWVAITQAQLLLAEDESDQAAEILETFVAREAEHKYAVGLLALASYMNDGYELAKPALHRAFQRCAKDFPQLVSNLADAIAEEMRQSQKHLASRAYLVFALRIAPEDKKADIFYRLMQFDGDRNIPYPLRSVHELRELTHLNDRESVRKATVLSTIGCWRPAARLFGKLTVQSPDDADLWYNVGLCRAWDGDEESAAEALHKAAELQDDFETAVEWETLAQLLDLNTTDDWEYLNTRQYRTSSVSQLLTMLDDDDRFQRVDITEEEEWSIVPEGRFSVVDHPERLQDAPRSYTIDTIPAVLGDVLLFDETAVEDIDESLPPRVHVIASEGDYFQTACRLLEDLAGDAVWPDESVEDDTVPDAPRELSLLKRRWFSPKETPLRVQRDLQLQYLQRATQSMWPETPLTALNGQSPQQVASNDELRAQLRVPLRAAVAVLDAYCDRSRYALGTEALLKQLRISPPAPAEFDDEAALNSMTSVQLLRLPVAELRDEQLFLLLQRAALLHHSRFLYEALRETLNRPDIPGDFDEQDLLLSFIEVCREQGRYDEAFEAVNRGKEVAQRGEHAFEQTLQWIVRELSLRLEDPDDPEIQPLLQYIADYYFPKLPNLRPTMTRMVQNFGITPPWMTETAPVGTAGAESKQGIWTPEGAQPKTGAEKKLWLPGQQ